MRRFLDMLVYGGEKKVEEGVAPPLNGGPPLHEANGSSSPLSGFFLP